jgi:hypothetical protein
MTAPEVKPTILKLTRSMARYDFSKEPLASADIVIEKGGRICKNANGKSGEDATAEELKVAVETRPNR